PKDRRWRSAAAAPDGARRRLSPRGGLSLRRLLSSTVARLVAAIFLVQLISGGAAIYLLRMQMLRVVHAERVRQVGEVRDDLLQEYYDGGRARLAEAIASRSGSAADPLVFVALRGDGPAASTNVAELPVVRAD